MPQNTVTFTNVASSYVFKSPLHYLSPPGLQDNIVINGTLGFTADASGNVVVPCGAVLTRVSSAGATLGHFGKYDSAATDGRQLLVPGATQKGAQIVVTTADLVFLPTDGPKALGCLAGFCVFEFANLTTYTLTLAQLRSSFPTALFY